MLATGKRRQAAPPELSITLRLFASVRERAGTSKVDLTLPEGTDVEGALVAASTLVPGEWKLPSRLLIAVNGEYAQMSTVLNDGDEVALIPPVSGGAGGPPARRKPATPPEVLITDQPIDDQSLVAQVKTDRDGAVVTFLGVTRDHNDGRSVLYLEYEAYQPMAEQKMLEIIAEMKARWEISRVAVVHRTGRVDIGETSMVLAVSAPHRRPAFEAALHFIDRLKESVPIWKKEHFTGGEVWVGETPGTTPKGPAPSRPSAPRRRE